MADLRAPSGAESELTSEIHSHAEDPESASMTSLSRIGSGILFYSNDSIIVMIKLLI